MFFHLCIISFSIFFLKCIYVNLLFFLFLAWYYYLVWIYYMGFPCGSAGIICLQWGRPGFSPWVGKIPWRRKQLPTPVFWPGEFHGLYSPWGHKESDMTERLSLSLGYTTVCLSIFQWMYNWIVSTFSFMHGVVMYRSVLFQTYTVVSLSIYLEVFLEVLG